MSLLLGIPQILSVEIIIKWIVGKSNLVSLVMLDSALCNVILRITMCNLYLAKEFGLDIVKTTPFHFHGSILQTRKSENFWKWLTSRRIKLTVMSIVNMDADVVVLKRLFGFDLSRINTLLISSNVLQVNNKFSHNFTLLAKIINLCPNMTTIWNEHENIFTDLSISMLNIEILKNLKCLNLQNLNNNFGAKAIDCLIINGHNLKSLTLSFQNKLFVPSDVLIRSLITNAHVLQNVNLDTRDLTFAQFNEFCSKSKQLESLKLNIFGRDNKISLFHIADVLKNMHFIKKLLIVYRTISCDKFLLSRLPRNKSMELSSSLDKDSSDVEDIFSDVVKFLCIEGDWNHSSTSVVCDLMYLFKSCININRIVCREIELSDSVIDVIINFQSQLRGIHIRDCGSRYTYTAIKCLTKIISLTFIMLIQPSPAISKLIPTVSLITGNNNSVVNLICLYIPDHNNNGNNQYEITNHYFNLIKSVDYEDLCAVNIFRSNN